MDHLAKFAFVALAVLALNAMAASGAMAATKPRCPSTTSYTLRTTDARGATPVWKTAYSAYSTYNIYFADDIVGGSITGTHTQTIYVYMPDGSPYQRFDQTYTSTSSDAITCGIRLWESMPVAGTIIDQYGIYGTWTARAYIDGVEKASTSFTIAP